jgi:hypothetical protein
MTIGDTDAVKSASHDFPLNSGESRGPKQNDIIEVGKRTMA